MRQEMADDKYYAKCARHAEMTCKGRITWEHCWIYAGKQINEPWAILPLCEWHHAVNQYQDSGDLNKKLNKQLSLARATKEDLLKYPKKNFEIECK